MSLFPLGWSVAIITISPIQFTQKCVIIYLINNLLVFIGIIVVNGTLISVTGASLLSLVGSA